MLCVLSVILNIYRRIFRTIFQHWQIEICRWLPPVHFKETLMNHLKMSWKHRPKIKKRQSLQSCHFLQCAIYYPTQMASDTETSLERKREKGLPVCCMCVCMCVRLRIHVSLWARPSVSVRVCACVCICATCRDDMVRASSCFTSLVWECVCACVCVCSVEMWSF